MYKLIALLAMTLNFAFAGEGVTGSYSYVDGTDHTECPAAQLSVKGNENEGYSLYGSTGLGAKGPFVNRFYFSEVNNGEIYEGNYIYKTDSRDGRLVKNVKLVVDGRVLIEEEVIFKTSGSSAVLEHKLLKNDSRAKQWRHPSFKCFYSKD